MTHNWLNLYMMSLNTLAFMKTFQNANFEIFVFLKSWKLEQKLIRFRKNFILLWNWNVPMHLKNSNELTCLITNQMTKLTTFGPLEAQGWKSTMADSVDIFVINQETFNRDQATNQNFQRKTVTFVFQCFDMIFHYYLIDNFTK